MTRIPERSTSLWPILSMIVGAALLLIALPGRWKEWAPSFLASADFHLGLDLAGGTQLDFRISEDEIEEQLQRIRQEVAALEAQGAAGDRLNALRLEEQIIQEQRATLVEAIRTVLERRINALGVSEATITPSYVGPEKHLLVECPGIVDVQTCIKTVGKTIQLEFKEEFTEPTEEFTQGVQRKAQAALDRIRTEKVSLTTLGQDLGDELGIVYQDRRLLFRDELPKGLELLWTARPGSPVREFPGSITTTVEDEEGKPREQEVPGIFLAEVIEPKVHTGRTLRTATDAFQVLTKEQKDLRYALHERVDLPTGDHISSTLRQLKPGELRTALAGDSTARVLFLRNFFPGREEVEASHILIAYKGAQTAGSTVTRTKEEALSRAKELRTRILSGARFEELARRYSDGPSSKNDGRLGAFGRGAMVGAFEAVAFNLPPKEISEPVETPFGYHLVRVDRAPSLTPDKASYEELIVPGPDAETHAGNLLALLQSGKVQRREEVLSVRFLFFSLLPSGWKDTPLDGKHFRTATVTTDPSSRRPVVQILFDDEGGQLFQELTKQNVGKRIAIFVGGQMVSAPVVQEEISGGSAIITGSANFDEARTLAQDLNTGAIPAPIHLAGQRTVEPTLGAEALRTSVKAGIVGMVVLMLYMLAVYRLFGVLANLALLVYAVIFLAILKLPLFLFSGNFIVLTLAGAAGMILSIGMAVDTNVLIFERIKEELRKGKLLSTAVELGFQRAWPSIRDSNVSTLITCAILFSIGTSIVRGFAITLGTGVLISMFTGMIVARWMCRKIAGTSLARSAMFFGSGTASS